jgi:hypothetical protein
MADKDKPLEPGTKGHKIAFGDKDNVWVYDLDENGGTINLRPEGEPAPEAPEADED